MKTKTKRATRRTSKTLDELLAGLIADRIKILGLTQTSASYRMKTAPSQISLVVTGKLRGFSTTRLLKMAMALGYSFTLEGEATPTGKPGMFFIWNQYKPISVE